MLSTDRPRSLTQGANTSPSTRRAWWIGFGLWLLGLHGRWFPRFMAGILEGISRKGTHLPEARKRRGFRGGRVEPKWPVQDVANRSRVWTPRRRVLGLAIGAMVIL